MTPLSRIALAPLGLALLTAVGCAPADPKDYSQYREHMPASILVLPPTNQSVEVNAGYSVASSITTPLAAAGYYVFPIAVVDTYFKENGLPSAADMHGVPLDKIREVFGADAVLYLDVKQYGQDYKVVFSDTEVDVDAKLVDTASGLTLWEGRARGNKSSSDGNGGGGLIGLLVTAAVAQAVGTTVDAAHGVAVEANRSMVLGRDGLLLGPYHEGSALDLRGLPPEQAAPAEAAAEAAATE
ncbi:MAG: DUF799 family lipoprotein [Alphaproteobacteria bacterium]